MKKEQNEAVGAKERKETVAVQTFRALNSGEKKIGEKLIFTLSEHTESMYRRVTETKNFVLVWSVEIPETFDNFSRRMILQDIGNQLRSSANAGATVQVLKDHLTKFEYTCAEPPLDQMDKAAAEEAKRAAAEAKAKAEAQSALKSMLTEKLSACKTDKEKLALLKSLAENGF